METLRQDLGYGLRMFFKNPRFTVVAVLSLAIGIGATTAIFSVANALLLRPLPYKDADSLVILWNRSPGLNMAQDWFSPGQYLDIKAENKVFEHVAATIDSSFNLTGDGTSQSPERVEGARVSASLFPLLNAQAMMGRVFTPDEDEQGKPTTAILSHGFWQRRFAGQREVIGKTLTLNGNPVEIVGVMQPDFALNKEVMPTVNKISNAEMLLSLPMGEGKRSTRTNEDYNIFGRLRPGVSVVQAQADVDRIVSGMKQQYPQNYPPGYFAAMGVPLVKGRLFDERDVKGAAETVIVNENLAQRFWPNDPIGRRLERGDKEPWRTVVGVVRDTKEFSVDNEPPISIYHPHEQFPIGTMFVVVRAGSPGPGSSAAQRLWGGEGQTAWGANTVSDPAQMTPAIIKEIHSLDSELPAFEVKTMDQRLADSLARRRFSTFLLGVFAVVALILAAIGIYGVMAYSVSQRTQEIGIRMALGAQPGKIALLVIRQSFVLVILGTVIGLVGAFALTRIMSSLLYGVSATDLRTFVLPPLVLGGIALVASYFPARRAARVDPAIALRSE